MPRYFVDRMGRQITDPRAIEARTVMMYLRRLSNIAAKAGKEWPEQCTVGELAKACKLTPERIVAIVKDYDAWLWGFSRQDGPVEDWTIYEDGE